MSVHKEAVVPTVHETVRQMHNARHIWTTIRLQIYQQLSRRTRRLIFVSTPGHVFYTKAPVLKLCSTKFQGSMGDFHGFHKHISIITTLVNIILICFIGIFYFLSHIWAYSALDLFSDYIINNKSLFFTNMIKHLILLNKALFKKKGLFGFYTQQGLRKNSNVVTGVPQILWGRIPLH